MRSRAVSLPALCSRARRSGPPPASASAEMRRSSSMRSLGLSCFAADAAVPFSSGKRASRGWRHTLSEDAHGQMRGEPHGPQQKHDAEQQLDANGDNFLQRRLERSGVGGGFHQDAHGAERHGNDQNSRENGSQNLFHKTGARMDSAQQRIAQVRPKSNARDAIRATG